MTQLTRAAILAVCALALFTGLSRAEKPAPARPASAAETCMAAVTDLVLKKVDGAASVEFTSLSEGNSLAHEDTRTYSGLAQPYDKNRRPIGRFGHWNAKTNRNNGWWVVEKGDVEFEQPKPTPVK